MRLFLNEKNGILEDDEVLGRELHYFLESNDEFTKSFRMIMGVDSYDELLDKVNSKNAESIEFEVDGYSV